MGRDLMARIEAIDWASHRHSYGPASDVPELLRTLATADHRSRRRALAELALRLQHLGRCAPVAVVVVPFLVELSGDPAVRGRAAIITLLGNLARVGDDAVKAAVAEGSDTYLAALGDRGADVRAAALFVHAHLPAHVSVMPAIRACLADADAHVRASAYLALGCLGERAPAAGDAEPVERFAIASAAAMGGLATITDARELIGALAARNREPLPWNDGDVAGMARSCLELVSVEVLLDALGEIPDGDRDRRLAVYDVAEVLLRVAGHDEAVAAALTARTDVWQASRIVRAARAAGL